MDRIRTKAVTQFTLEEDMNLPESKPDVNALNLRAEEAKAICADWRATYHERRTRLVR